MNAYMILSDAQCTRLEAGLPNGSEFKALVTKAQQEGRHLDGYFWDQVCFPPCDRVTAERFLEAVKAVDRSAAHDIRNAILETEGR